MPMLLITLPSCWTTSQVRAICVQQNFLNWTEFWVGIWKGGNWYLAIHYHFWFLNSLAKVCILAVAAVDPVLSTPLSSPTIPHNNYSSNTILSFLLNTKLLLPKLPVHCPFQETLLRLIPRSLHFSMTSAHSGKECVVFNYQMLKDEWCLTSVPILPIIFICSNSPICHMALRSSFPPTKHHAGQRVPSTKEIETRREFQNAVYCSNTRKGGV